LQGLTNLLLNVSCKSKFKFWISLYKNIFQTGQFAEGFVVNGVLHGPFTILGITQILPVSIISTFLFFYRHLHVTFFKGRKLRRDNNHRLSIGMGFIGTYSNGRADGEFWIGMKGNGYLHGILEFNLI